MPKVKKPKPILGPTFLRAWRNYRGMTQDQVAEAVDISRALLSKIENGKSPYSQAQLEALAQIYRCTPGDLLDRDPRDGGAELASLIRNLPANQQAQVADIVQVIRRAG